ncbi:hypothetical protein AB2M62_18490 [Sphingomonas sp. MMS12-HWE2-04]|uniref:hypothetical protein n=1 Tax=Sphingomonas sp. MMS12-HWE2-04 TaxID=3234199 RepID=UPI00384FEEE4
MECIRSGKGRVLQRAAKRTGWTPAKRRRFLSILAATCNVTHALREVGVEGNSSVYRLRQRDPEFAAQWQQALAMGYQRLEEALLAYAIAAIDCQIEPADPVPLGQPGDPAAATTSQPGSGLGRRPAPADVQLALLLLNRHRGTVDGTRRPRGFRRRVSPEETNASLRTKLDTAARQLGNHR